MEIAGALIAAAGPDHLHMADVNSGTCLLAACRRCHAEVVRALALAGGAGLLLALLPDGTSCLHIASAEGHAHVARELLQTEGARALLRLEDAGGRTSLSLACSEGRVGVALELVQAGPSGPAVLQRADADRATGLIAASGVGYAEVVQALLALPVDRDALLRCALPDGCTALHATPVPHRHPSSGGGARRGRLAAAARAEDNGLGHVPPCRHQPVQSASGRGPLPLCASGRFARARRRGPCIIAHKPVTMRDYFRLLHCNNRV